MATNTNTTTRATTNAKGKGKAAPKAAPAAQAPAAPAAPQAPMFTLGPWPAKAQGGNTIRAYCYAVAKALAAQHPQGFTVAQYASALAANASGTTLRQPSGGWGTAAKPNGIAMQHANWFAHPKQGWLAPVAQG